MNTQKLQRTIVDALEDIKAQEIQVYNTTDESDLFDRVILASGTSNRQTRALAKSVMDKVRENGGTIIGCEGEESGDWVLVDCGDIVVHIMQPAVRAFYNLEEVWGRKPVRMKMAPDSLRTPNQQG
jgi:ribosome-associated protein